MIKGMSYYPHNIDIDYYACLSQVIVQQLSSFFVILLCSVLRATSPDGSGF